MLTAVAFLLSRCGNGLCSGSCIQEIPGISGASSAPNDDGTVTVNIEGTGFENGMTVTVNGTPCTNVNVLSSTQLTCVLPNGRIALVNIIVTTPSGGGSGGSSSNFMVSSTAGTASHYITVQPVTDLDNAKNNVSTYASLQGSNANTLTSQILLLGYFTDSSYTIPPSANIDGLKVNCKWSYSAVNQTVRAYVVTLVKAGTPTGANRSDSISLPSTMTLSADYGSSTDLWGTTWTPSEINSSTFGLSLRFSAESSQNALIDYCQLSVYYH